MGRAEAQQENTPTGNAVAGRKDATPETRAGRPWAAEGSLRPDAARKAAGKGEKLFRSLFENVATGMAVLDLEGCFIDTNPALQQMLDYTGEELRRMDISRVVHPDDFPKARAALDDLRHGRGTQKRMEVRYILKGWALRWGRVTGSLMAGTEGDAPLIVAALENITEHVLTSDSLRASMERYKDLFDNAAAGVATADLDGCLTSVNRTLCALSGYSEEELLGRHFSEFIPPNDLDRLQALSDAVFSRERLELPIEFRLVRKDGQVVHCFTSPRASYLHGELVGFNAIIQDMTARRRAEDELEKLASVVKRSGELIALTTPGGRLLFLNDAGIRRLGVSPDDVGRTDMMEIIPPELCRKVTEEVLPQVKAGGSWKGELTYRNAGSGELTEVQATAFSISDPRTGAIQYLAYISLDITGRKRAEAELVRLSTAVRLARESILIMDPSGNVSFANEAASSLLAGGAPRSGLWDFAGHIAPPDRERWRLVLAETLRRGSVHDVELDLDAGGGRLVPIEVSATAMANGGRGAAEIVAILRDITEQKLAQRQMRSRLMAFRLEDGWVYLVKESAPILSMEGFRDLLRAGYRGTVLSRTPPRRLAPDSEEVFGRMWLSERAGPDSLAPGPAHILSWADTLPRNHAILVDRMDYLISRNGFRAALGLIHRLREIAYLMGHIVIISLDPATLDDRRLRVLEKETAEMAPRRSLRLPPEQLEIIRYVFEQSITGERPSLTDIGDALGLSKPTARKRSRDAARDGFITLCPHGRTKVAELTEKGRGVFAK